MKGHRGDWSGKNKWRGKLNRGLKDGIRAGTSNLMAHIEIYYSGSLVNYIHIRERDIIESSNNGGDNIPTRHLMPTSENYSARNGLHLVELLAKWAPCKPPNVSGSCQGHLLHLMVRP